MLSVENIHLSYTEPILKGVSFSVEAGEIIGIAGQSGAGKTSLLKLIGGLVDASEGFVYLEGKRVVGPSLRLIPGHPEIQLVNQDFNLDLYQTTEENIKGKILHLPKDIQEQFTEELLDVVELTHTKNQLAHTLSGGEQQRLAIVRALALEPKLLLLDEPFVHLDSQLRMRLISYLVELKKIRNMGVLIVSHNSEELLSLTDRIIYIKDGTIRRDAKPLDFYYRYKSVREARVFGLINRIKTNDKVIHFRPDEYEIDSSQTPVISIAFQHAIFMGSYYLNEFSTENNKKIILLNKEPLSYVRGIKIVKK